VWKTGKAGQRKGGGVVPLEGREVGDADRRWKDTTRERGRAQKRGVVGTEPIRWC